MKSHLFLTAMLLALPVAGATQNAAPTRIEAEAAPANIAGQIQIPGLAGAALRPGWTTPEGRRMVALDLRLQPGWKTYWRAPGDAGIPPQLDWDGSSNLGAVTIHWPAPEVIDSAGSRTLGFHDRLILPIEIAPAAPGTPVQLALAVDFGLCREVCVPAHVRLTAPPPGEVPDPVIEAALATVPVPSGLTAQCRVTPIDDGLRIAASLPFPAQAGTDGRTPLQNAPPDPGQADPRQSDVPAAAMEMMAPQGADAVWVSEAEVTAKGGVVTATADFVPPSGAPFALDLSAVRLTLIGADGQAVQIDGCAADG